MNVVQKIISLNDKEIKEAGAHYETLMTKTKSKSVRANAFAVLAIIQQEISLRTVCLPEMNDEELFRALELA